MPTHGLGVLVVLLGETLMAWAPLQEAVHEIQPLSAAGRTVVANHNKIDKSSQLNATALLGRLLLCERHATCRTWCM
jgi:hypothetical protein